MFKYIKTKYKTNTEAVYITLYASNTNAFILCKKTPKIYFTLYLFESVFRSCTAILDCSISFENFDCCEYEWGEQILVTFWNPKTREVCGCNAERCIGKGFYRPYSKNISKIRFSSIDQFLGSHYSKLSATSLPVKLALSTNIGAWAGKATLSSLLGRASGLNSGEEAITFCVSTFTSSVAFSFFCGFATPKVVRDSSTSGFKSTKLILSNIVHIRV